MKYVAISDTHGQHQRFDIPSGDVFIHAGDFSNHGSESEIIGFMQWVEQLPHAHKILVAGNHDIGFEREAILYESLVPAGVIYLKDQSLQLGETEIYGSPWTPRFYDWAFMKPRGAALRAVWQLIPSTTDLLITHGPPLHIADLTSDGDAAGCADLLDEVENRIKPRWHLFGHIHECGSQEYNNGVTRFANLAMSIKVFDL